MKNLLILLFFVSTTACSNADKVSKSTSDTNAILGFLVGQSSATGFVTDYNGAWNVGFTYNSQGQLSSQPTGRAIIATNPDGSGSIVSGNATNAGYFGGGDTTYRILSFNRNTRQLFYQNTPGNNNFSNSTFGRIDYTAVTTTGCEFNATKCFYACERVFSQTTLAAVQTSTLTSNTANPTASGSCAGFAFSRYLLRTDNSTW